MVDLLPIQPSQNDVGIVQKWQAARLGRAGRWNASRKLYDERDMIVNKKEGVSQLDFVGAGVVGQSCEHVEAPPPPLPPPLTTS